MLDDVCAERHHLVGELHEGLRVGLLGVGIGRLYNAAKSVGLGGWAISKAVDHARTRRVFGQTLSEHQGVTFPLAESATELHAARLMSRDLAERLDRREPALAEMAMAKGYATEAALRAIDRAIQVHGALGFTNEMHLTEAWQDIRKVCVADGTAELMRRQVATMLMSGRLRL